MDSGAQSFVIGGADGPTAIFLAGSFGEDFKAGVIIFVVCVLFLAAFLEIGRAHV